MFPKTEVKASSSPPGGGRNMGHKSRPLWSSNRTNWKTQSVCACCDFTTEKCRAGEQDNQAIKSYIVDTTVVFSLALFKVEYCVVEQVTSILSS